MQYRAFISYAHSDGGWAAWLQAALERYRIPPEIVGRHSQWETPGRLYPIFRDRDELASSSDLSRSIRNALDQSAALIVVCSLHATQSKWMNEEIRYFQSIGRAEHIHCLLVSGSPDRTSATCAFPPALLHTSDGRSLPDPLAADVNEDGRRGALLKIAAGLLNVGVDNLKQRDAQRVARRRGFVAGASLLIAMLMLGFAIVAQLAREEAELRRGQAENLIGFMLGDLRARLQPIGKLDVLDAIGDQAMDYFTVLGQRGTDQELLSRVMALRQIGEVRFRQGRLAPAQQTFEESRDLAEALHTSAPENHEYLFELGQAEFWVGYAALEQANLQQTSESFTRYMQHSRTLVEADPDNDVYQAELSYAYSNLGTVAMEQMDASAALTFFEQSVQLRMQLAAADPENLQLATDLGNGYSWLGETHLQLGHLEQSRQAFQQAVDLLTRLHARNASPLVSEHLSQNAYHLGNVLLHLGEINLASDFFEMAGRLLEELVTHDPDNAIWRSDRAINAFHQGELLRISGLPQAARQQLVKARDDFDLLLTSSGEITDLRSAEYLALTERSLSLLDHAFALVARARHRMDRIVSTAESMKPRTALNAALIFETYGYFLQNEGDASGAQAAWQHALDILHQTAAAGPDYLALQHNLLINLDQHASAQPIAARLRAMGYMDPRMLQPAANVQ